MVTIEIGNSLCKARGLTRDVLSTIRNATCYEVKSGRRIRVKTKKGTWRLVEEKKTYHLTDRHGCFPTGLLYLVEDTLNQRKIPFKIIDTREVPKLNQLGVETLFIRQDYEPYPEQTCAAVAALENGRGIIVGPTGVGKSAIAALTCDAFQVKTLIVVPSLELKRQLIESLRHSFGEDRVGPLVNKKAQYFITVENVDALDPTKPLKGVNLVIIDEFHHSAAATYRKLNLTAWSEVYYKIGLTATPFRSTDDERLLLESVLSHVIYRIEYETAVAKGYIVPMEVYYVDLPKRPKAEEHKTFHGAYKALVVENDARNKIIADMVANLCAAGKSTLVLTKQINHGVRLQDLLMERDCDVPFAEGTNELKSEYIKAFNRLDESALIGTVGVLGEGVDTKPAEYVILAGGGKSKNQFMQNCGRGFRNFTYPHGRKESCKIILFRDPNNKWLLEHFESCLTYLKDEYGIIPTKLDLGA
jgi:superfamily II DNA or RNA helicase